MVQRIVLVIVLLLMIGLTVFGVIYVAPMITGADTSFLVTPRPTPTPIPTPTPTPSPTPTPVLPTPTPTPAPFISGQEAYLINADTGQVFYSMNAAQSVPIASTTKIMTALVAIENANLEQGVTVQQADLDQVPNGSSSAGLVAGDYFRLRTLLYGLMLRSGTDASIVIARVAAGSTDNFVAMMNSKAQALGLTHTHYSSPHGFSSNNYSSAIDMVTLANYALRNPTFASIVAQSSYTVKPTMYTHEYQWDNTNSLLTSYPGADGVKTGWTDDAGVCLVFSARRNGHHLIGVELHAPDYPTVFTDSAKLLDLGFSKE
jgi:D-alanyl-D-alanine carboxypeptidase (penicillin-binding protein 5/6)